MGLGILIICIAVVIWVLLFFVVFNVATRVEEHLRQIDKKLYDRDSDDSKKTTQMYIVIFFVGIPILLIIAVLQEVL